MSEATANKNGQAKPLSGALKIFYGVGDCGFSLMTNVESYYFNFFLTNLAAFPLGVVTTIATVFSGIDAALSWIYGAVLNSIKPKKWGRYRSWLILITWLVPFIFAFQFIKVSDNVAVSAAVVLIAAVLSHVCWNFPYVANVSMIAVAGKTPEDRAQLASTRAAWGNLSKILFAYVGPPIAAFFAAHLSETNQWGATAFVLAWVMFALYFCHFKMFEGYEEVETDGQTAKKDTSRTSGGDLLKALAQNPPLIALLLSDVAKWMFNFVCMGAAVYYFTYVAGNPGLMSRYILISNILCVIGSYCSKFFSKKLSTRTTTFCTFFLMAVFMLIANFMYTNVTAVIILMSVAQFGYGIAYAATPALYADTIIYSEWKTGKNATGWISGLQNVPLKVSILTRGIIINGCLAAAHFSPDIAAGDATEELKRACTNAFILVPAVALIIAGCLVVFGFRLTKDKVEKYSAEIAARKA
ncbi:MAG: MFS transporter [Eubacterium sp.]|nr:MFS transporter [Eubacterium sp.]